MKVAPTLWCMIWGNSNLTDPNKAEFRALGDVPSALDQFADLKTAIGGRTPAIFLDYDGTLTPIVERPELAIMGDAERATVDALARKLPVAVVSGRDRPDVENLVGIASLIFAGSHGFDIRLPDGGNVDSEVGGDFTPLLDRVEARLQEKLGSIEGALVERKKFSIAAHYRLVADADYPAFRAVLDALLADTPDLKEKPGKKVWELQPNIDWDKGKCVHVLLKALKLDGPEYCPMFFGDDVTDEDAFAALQGEGVTVICAPLSDAGRTTAATFRVDDVPQVIDLLRRLTPGA